MIQRLDVGRGAFNPVRPFIRMEFVTCRDDADQLDRLADLLTNRFNPQTSRAIVFVRTRRRAEDLAEQLAHLPRLRAILADAVDFFHGALSADERESKAEEFRQGKIRVLCATKAFGMGMDIPNIHLVAHFGPSSSFEDFLQEIGRAGRNAEARRRAGFSEESPIRTACLLTQQDFGRLRDLMHKSQLRWGGVGQVFGYLTALRAEYALPLDQALPLPLDFIGEVSGFADRSGSASTNARLALYWLEQAGRIRLGYYLPAYLAFDTAPLDAANPADIADDAVRTLVDFLKQERTNHPAEAERIAVPLTRLMKALGEITRDDLMRAISRGQRLGVLAYAQHLRVSVPKKYEAEQAHFAQIPVVRHPEAEAVFVLARRLLGQVAPGQSLRLAPEALDEEMRRTFNEFFTPEQFPWLKPPRAVGHVDRWRDAVAKRRKGWEQKRGHRCLSRVFYLLNSLPGVRHRTEIAGGEVVQTLSRSLSKKADALRALEEFRQRYYVLLTAVYRGAALDPDFRLGIAEAYHLLGDPKLGDFERAKNFFNQMGLARLDGSVLPMAIEVFQPSTEPLSDQPDHSDALVRERFRQGQRMRKLRLLTLAGFSQLDPARHTDYINGYFQCQTADDVVALLEEYLGPTHEFLREFRDEALERAVGKLNAGQKAVYEAPPEARLNVVAGPGSGKTHTLTLRVARLIHREAVPPAQILVLAYNRAVVVELRQRLNKLFTELGYHRLAQSLQVYTFHGFIRRCLGERLEGVDFNRYADEFIRACEAEPGLVLNRVGTIRHVLVDEFQDITSSRLEVLKKLVQGGQSITVIGDPNQSIYGFDRLAPGEATRSVSPKPYYEAFATHFSPQLLTLSENFRSYADILTLAEAELRPNAETFGMPALKAFHQPLPDWPADYAQRTGANGSDWLEAVAALANAKKPKGEAFGQVAVLFRGTNELYRAYKLLSGRTDLRAFPLRIQGAGESFARVREIAYVLRRWLAPRGAQPFPADPVAELNQFLENPPIPAAWSSYALDVLRACLLEFGTARGNSSATFADFQEFFEEIAQREDGQLSRVYHTHGPKLPGYHRQTELVLSTMHRVKGLEFDGVVVPPSIESLPFGKLDGVTLHETYEEERRLRYVAFSRARFRLRAFTWKREEALEQNLRWALSADKQREMGIAVKDGLDKFYMSWVASQPVEVMKYVGNSIRANDPVELHRDGGGYWYVVHLGERVSRLKKDYNPAVAANVKRITGFLVTSVYVYTLEESETYDLKHESDYTRSWTNDVRNVGYTYLVDFAGYGKPEA